MDEVDDMDAEEGMGGFQPTGADANRGSPARRTPLFPSSFSEIGAPGGASLFSMGVSPVGAERGASRGGARLSTAIAFAGWLPAAMLLIFILMPPNPVS